MVPPGTGEDDAISQAPGTPQRLLEETKGHAMTEQQIVDIITDTLGPNVPLTLEQLSVLLMVLAIATVLLAAGLGYQIARAERRIKALEMEVRHGRDA